MAREWGSNTAFYHSDAGGNVTRLVDSSGNVQATYQYDSYGALVSQSGSWATANPYLFSGKRYLGDGLYYFGYRFYNTDLQRWINKDPLGESGGINLYGYVGNAPTTSVDPLGLIIFDEDGAPITPTGSILDAYFYDEDTKATHDRIMCEGNKAVMGAAKDVVVAAGSAIIGGLVDDAIYAGVAVCVRPLAKALGRAPGGGLNIYRHGDATAERATGWKEGDRFLNLPPKGTPKQNWAQNSSRLREEMRRGEPIYDSYRTQGGAQIRSGQTPTSGGRFLRAERELLENHGWRYNPTTGAYHPPTTK